MRERIEAVEQRIVRACEKAGRARSEITLVAVTKKFGAEIVRQAYDLGLRVFGENYVQEFEGKRPLLGELPGALAGAIGVLTPAAVLAYFVTRLWDRKPNTRGRTMLLNALVPVTIGLTLSSGYLITLGAARSTGAVVLIVASTAAFFFTRMHPMWWIVTGAMLGYLGLV